MSGNLSVKVKKLNDEAVLPTYGSVDAAGFDFYALEDVFLGSEEVKLVKTGLAFEIPRGYELQVRPRSGISLKTSLRVANAPGTVDSDYRGEVCVIIENTSSLNCANISKGDRIAQGVICPVIQSNFELVDELSDTERGEGGFGSSGK